MEIKFSKEKFKLQWLLLALFVLVLLFAAYTGYFHLYSKIFRPPEKLPEGNVVRVNLEAYEATVDYLESLYDYKAPDLKLPRSNPFQ